MLMLIDRIPMLRCQCRCRYCIDITHQFLGTAPYTTRQSDWWMARCQRIDITSPALRCARCHCATPNKITRIALCNNCVRHVGPTRSYFTAKLRFSYSISDKKSGWVGGLSDEITYWSAYGVTHSAQGFLKVKYSATRRGK